MPLLRPSIGGTQLHRGRSRDRNIGLAAVFGIFIAVYATVATAFYWLMQPTVAGNRGLAAYSPPPNTVVRYADTPWIPPDPSDTSAPLVPIQRTSEPVQGSAAAAPAPKTDNKTRETAAAPARRQHAARARPTYNYPGRAFNAFAFRPWF
jgi:hypothetical protein